jgi:dienelactone hydrolase
LRVSRDESLGALCFLQVRSPTFRRPFLDVKDPIEPTDDNAIPHVPTFADAIAYIAKRPDADLDRIGLVGYSLGAATAMTYIASNPPGKVKVLVDFFGPLNGAIEAGVARFPPTFIRHNTNDQVVNVAFSQKLDRLLGSIEHDFFACTEENLRQGHHPFVIDGPADKDSRQKAKDWIVSHLPPVGK